MQIDRSLPDLCGAFNNITVRIAHHGHQEIQQENCDDNNVEDQ